MTDYEIAKQTKLLPIEEVARQFGIKENELEFYGPFKAKINRKGNTNDQKGHLILVTSTSPTPFGEGKTTLSIGINDSLNAIGKKSVVVLREPSLGPVFGIKGGATGGGLSQVAPMDDINLHFTGDIHALTSANNLLAAIIDNHIFQGNTLNLDPERINFQRCQDVNDRALRHVHLEATNRDDSFTISTASEMMAILCMAKDLEDLKTRLGNIFIGYTKDDKEIFARDLDCIGALAILLKDAIKPNLVQTLENNLAIIHGGPFANIAHGCNSIIATNLGLDIADYVITEAGFGSDMGGLKFLDLKCRLHQLTPDLIVINTTIRGLKYNGVNKDDLKTGLENLRFHVENMRSFGPNVLVVLNKFADNLEEDINIVKEYCDTLNVSFALSECFAKGSSGGKEMAEKIVSMINDKKELILPYDLNDELDEKITRLCKTKYHAKEVIYSEKASIKLEQIKKSSLSKLPVCIAKTQYSISDDQNLLGYPTDFTMTVTDLKINSGAGFITACMGSIMTMPGLSKKANYLNMDITNDVISGLF